ncbi:DUF4384 domain-containing protein [Nannocystis pusilla]|uniref:DUF4384 domain-containing protein n=1 Tax=Nannocystis pusilla TaxID=889268 RepID=A0ABS7TV89_9BACT|nr:DUF4384 domain-containing protein [Nannocystis pusilla]MBZ5712154.1 DUF4384 domain-containing protein [Nannocystis pusilla]
MSLGSCTKQGFLAAPKADGEVAEKIGGFSSDTHFLLEPTGDAEGLLGRQVRVTSAGAWTIADERAPGCEVRVKESSSSYKKKYRVGLGDLTAFAGGYKDMLKLEARYGRSVEAEYEIVNVKTLTADTEGPCGEVIVKSVRVGSGFRKLVRSAEGAAKGRAGKAGLGIEGGREAATEALDSMEWSDPQAYAFSYDRAAQQKQFDFSAVLPDKFTDGDPIRFEFAANETAYLIVIVLEESGVGGVLYPSGQVSLPTVKGKSQLVLPSPDETKIKAQLRDPKTAARETLVVYAFTHREDFDRFKPAAMDAGEGLAYAEKLEKALSQVPISRWARVTQSYEIVPKDGE